MATKKLTLTLPEETLEILKELAKTNRRSMSNQVDVLIYEEAKRKELI